MLVEKLNSSKTPLQFDAAKILEILVGFNDPIQLEFPPVR